MTNAGVYTGEILPPIAADRSRRLRRVQRLARLLDNAFRIPGTNFRLGIDALIGLIPGGGDAAMAATSLYIVWEAWRMGVPRHLLALMLGNIAIETVIDLVPIAGDAFDAIFKANMRNVAIIERYLNTGA